MKKVVLKWGRGSVCGIQIVYKTAIVEEENIDNIHPLEILPEAIKRKVPYVRINHTSEAKRNYDFGSWVDYIEAEEIKRTDTLYQSYLTKLALSNTKNA